MSAEMGTSKALFGEGYGDPLPEGNPFPFSKGLHCDIRRTTGRGVSVATFQDGSIPSVHSNPRHAGEQSLCSSSFRMPGRTPSPPRSVQIASRRQIRIRRWANRRTRRPWRWRCVRRARQRPWTWPEPLEPYRNTNGTGHGRSCCLARRALDLPLRRVPHRLAFLPNPFSTSNDVFPANLHGAWYPHPH